MVYDPSNLIIENIDVDFTRILLDSKVIWYEIIQK